MMKEDARQAGSNFSTLEKVSGSSGEKTEHFQLHQTVGFYCYYFFMSAADSHLPSELHAGRTFEQQQPKTHFPTTHADQGAIKLEQPNALGLSG